MSRLLRRCIAAAAVFALAGPLPASAADTTDAVIAVERFHDALTRGFPEVALDCLDRDVIVYEEGNIERSAQVYATSHLRADMEFSAAVPRTITNRKSDRVGDLAWVITEARVTGNFRGRDVDRITTETMVLRRDIRGVWRIVHIHWSSKPAPSATPPSAQAE